MQEKKITRAKKVIDALRKHYGLKVGEFAEMLGVGGSTVSTWAMRDSLDEDLIYRKCEGVNFKFLETGEGEMFQNPISVSEQHLSYGDPLRQELEKELDKLNRAELAKLLHQLLEKAQERDD